MKTASWGITHNIADDVIVMSLYGMFDHIICKTYLSTILQEAGNINGFIFQMNSVNVPPEKDLSELIASVRRQTAIQRIAIIASNNSRGDVAEKSLEYSIFKDSDVKICFDVESAIDWSSQIKSTYRLN